MRSEGAEGSSASSDCDDPLVVIACAAESDACPAACRENAEEEQDQIVKSGSLVVTAAAANNRSALLGGKLSDLDTLTFKTSEEVTITKVVLERYGYSSADDVAAVWLENEDGKIISSKAETATKGQYKLTIDKDYRNVDGIANATIVLQTVTPTPITHGSNIGFKVVDVTSTAKDVNLDDYSPYTYDLVSYNGTSISFDVRGSDRTYNYEEGESYEVAKFRINAAEDSAALVRGFTLTDTVAGTLDIEDETFEDVVVTVDDKEVKASWSVDEDKEQLTVSFDEVEIAARGHATFAVSIKLADDFDKFGTKLSFEIANISDVNAVEKKTGSRVSASGALPTMKVYTFNGGKIRLNSEKLGAVDAGIDATDVKVAEGSIELSQAIKSDSTNKLEITVTLVPGTKLTTYNGANTPKYVKKIIEGLRVVIDGEDYSGTPAATDATSVVYTFPTIEIEKSGKIQVLIDTYNDSDFEGSTMTFKMNNLDKFYYSDGKSTDKVDISGSLNFSKVTIQGAKSSLSNNLTDEVEYRLNEVNRYTVFDGTFTAKKSDINLQKFTVATAEASLNLGNNKVTFYLLVDGKEVADASATTAGAASDSFSDVLVKAGESVSVKLEAEVDAKDVQSIGKFSLTLDGEDANGTPITPVSKNTAALSVVKLGTPTTDPVSERNTVLLRGKNNTIAEFTVKPSGSSNIDLETVSFKVSGANCSELALYVDGTAEDISLVNGVCASEEFNVNVDESGVVVRVERDSEPTFSSTMKSVTIDSILLNGIDANKSFRKGYADALLTFNQEKYDAQTKFTVASIEKYNGATQVSNLHFYDKNGNEIITTLAGGALSQGDTFTVENAKEATLVKKMSYTVKRNANVQTVVVNYSDYGDYFKTNDGDLQVYANSNNQSSVKNTFAAVVTAASQDALPASVTWLPSNTQKGITISDSNEISGTLCKGPYTNAGESVDYVIYLKFDNVDATYSIYNHGTPVNFDADKDAVIGVSSTSDTIKLKDPNGNIIVYSLAGLTLSANASDC